jgi:hypothetical protein
MTHLDEGRLLSLRDAPSGHDKEAVQHVASCEACRSALDAARMQEEEITNALTSLDEAWDLDAARAAVGARVAEESGRAAQASVVPTPQRRMSWSLSRAAGLVLLTAAGASAALPGSPVRGWLSEVFSSEVPAVVNPAAVDAPATAAAPESEDTGVRLAAASGPLQIVVQGLRPGEEVHVRLVPGDEAAVFAPVGSRFTSAVGRIEAATTAGPVRVELPRDVTSVALEVNGRIYLRNTAEGLSITGPALERTDSGIVFRLPNP